MKRKVRLGLAILGLLPAVANRSLAVMPPSTSLTEETATPPATTAATENLAATSTRARQIVDKLEEDERRFENILRAMEQHKKDKENKHDGHSLH